MPSIEMQFVSDGHRMSLDELIDLIAVRVANRVALGLNERSGQPPQVARHDPRKAVGIREAARILGLGRSTVWNFISEGRIRVVRLGRRVLIPMEVINSALQGGLPAPRRTHRK